MKKTFPVHPCYVDNDNLSQMGASLVPEGVTAEEGSQRVMPWGYLVYRYVGPTLLWGYLVYRYVE